ncbi:PepSY domain-containing protein [Methylogaea oryzae]|uniref:PepSY domain-containing protein n=1 Tax=Methylogaea oryzae TaxID=1295382 RepID=A0A8D4VJX1_9GAMM|nr:hypothetical protein [Methylogaea oryzae]BBL69443.1 hypothetical protein MoryE10_00490 [Methylogaea oryzae]
MGRIPPAWAVCALALSLWNGSAAAQLADPYRLPPSKQNLEPCRLAALALAPGTVENLGLLWQQGHYRFRFDIRSSDGQARKVFCDGATGRILPMETNPMSNTTVPPLDLAPDGRPGIKHGAP